MVYKYATQDMKNDMAKAVMTGQRVSVKQSVELAKYLKGKKVTRVLTILDEVIAKKHAVPYTRFNWDVGHKPGIMAGRYPVKTAETFKRLIKLAKANAADLALDVDNLVVHNIVAQKGAKSYHHGRHRGRLMKNTHIEAVVREKQEKDKK